jgi:hypothetical protein
MAQCVFTQAFHFGTPLTAGARSGPRTPKAHTAPQRPAPERRACKTSGV